MIERLKHEILVNAVKYCNDCKHRYPASIRCVAFPDKIPWDVLVGDKDHRFPVEGDNGVQFEPLPERAYKYAQERNREGDSHFTGRLQV